MSVVDIILYGDQSFSLDTDDFIAQLKSRWPDVQIGTVDETALHTVFQWRVERRDNFDVLGAFTRNGITYHTDTDENSAQIALWFREIVPSKERLIFLTTSMTSAPFDLTAEMRAEDILHAFTQPIDWPAFDQLIKSIRGWPTLPNSSDD